MLSRDKQKLQIWFTLRTVKMDEQLKLIRRTIRS